ncbi:hypothetical protein BDZ89DRAFT_1043153 [Hymenopellis radicata]|nr:hypothetical protein BDZ89DRAFT_1043153 [Hymenopellis radicata]
MSFQSPPPPSPGKRPVQPGNSPLHQKRTRRTDDANYPRSPSQEADRTRAALEQEESSEEEQDVAAARQLIQRPLFQQASAPLSSGSQSCPRPRPTTAASAPPPTATTPSRPHPNAGAATAALPPAIAPPLAPAPPIASTSSTADQPIVFRLVPPYDELVTCNGLETCGLAYSKQLHCLICISCAIVVPTKQGAITDHIRKLHSTYLNFKWDIVKVILQSIDPLVDNYPDIDYTGTTPHPFVQGLSMQHNAYGCSHCRIVSTSEKYLPKHHFKQKHLDEHARKAVKVLNNVTYQQISTQRQYPGFRIERPAPKYIIRQQQAEMGDAEQQQQPQEKEQSAFDLGVATLLAEAEKFDETTARTTGPIDARRLTPLLNRTQWLSILEDRDVGKLNQQSGIGARNTRLGSLTSHLYKYFDHSVGLLSKSEMLLLQKINSSDPEHDGINNKPLERHHQHKTTLKSYVLPINHFLCWLMFKPADNNWDGYFKYSTSTELTAAVDNLRTLINSTGDIPQTQFDAAVHKVFLNVWHRKWPIVRDDPWNDPTASFLACHALKDSGNFLTATDLTPILARIMRAMQFFTLRHVHSLSNANRNLDQVSHFNTVATYVQAKAGTTYSFLHSLMQYASAISQHSQAMPRIFWIDHKLYTAMMYSGQAITLDQLRQIPHRIQDAAAKLWSELQFGMDLRVDYPQFLSDNLVEMQPGYCFLDDTRNDTFAAKKWHLFNELMKHPIASKQFVLPNGATHAIAVRKWLQTLA